MIATMSCKSTATKHTLTFDLPASYLSADFKRTFQNYVELPLAVLEKRPAKYESQVQEGACSSHKPQGKKLRQFDLLGFGKTFKSSVKFQCIQASAEPSVRT